MKKRAFWIHFSETPLRIEGLDVISKNYLLMKPHYGNLLWLHAIITDVELMPNEKTQFNMCDNCNKFVETCFMGRLDNLALFEKKMF